MPEPAAKPKPGAKPDPKGKGKGAGLKKKVGPLPLWAWVAIVGGAAAAYWFLIRGQGGDGGEGFGGPEIVSGSGAAGYSPQEAASAGAPAANGAMAGQLDPETLAALQDSISAQVGDIRGHVTELEDAFAQSGYTMNDDKTWNAPGMGSEPGSLEDFVRSIIESYGGPQISPSTPAAAPGGVKWGGRVHTTKASIGRELAAHGVSYATWAARHPAAAKSLTGPAPKPHKPGKPAKPTQHAKPAKPPKRSAPARKPPKPAKPRKVVHRQPAPRARSGGRGRK